MVRVPKKDEKAEENPQLAERKRLKKLAFSKKLLSQIPSKPISHLNPSKTVIKHHGTDLVKKSQRKNRFLFSFPGLLAPVTGGKMGELKDLGSKNPILYLDFPQGRMKLFGTIVYPKNRYLTLHFSRGGKNVMCEDYFDNMIVFSDVWWIGTKDENPEEVQLEFPKELNEGSHVDYDFKGGAGVTSAEKPGARKECVELQSPRAEPEDDVSGGSDPLNGENLNNLMEVTPIRHSARTAGRTFNFAEGSSGDDSADIDSDVPELKENKINEHLDDAARSCTFGKTEDSRLVVQTVDSENVVARIDSYDKIEELSLPVKKSKELPLGKCGPLVQTTLSTLFEKMEEKKSTRSERKSPMPKVSGQRLGHVDSKLKADQAKAEGPRKKGTVIKERKAGTGSMTKRKKFEQQTSAEPPKVYERKKAKCLPTPPSGPAPASKIATSPQVEDDDIEEFSSASQDIDGSDEDWEA